MGYISGESRNQIYLLPETVDDYIGEDNPVRFLDAFVDKLDLGELGFQNGEWGRTRTENGVGPSGVVDTPEDPCEKAQNSSLKAHFSV